jgi:hypothetical protein
LELKYRLLPFFETAGVASLALELTAEPRFTGSNQSEKLGAAVSDDTSRAARPIAAAEAR